MKETLSTARISPRFLSWKRLDKLRASIIEGPLIGSSKDRAQSVHSVLRRARRNVTGTRQVSAFVTSGALLGIKSIGSHAEHVIALDADAMDDGADDGAGLQGLG